MMGLNEVAIHKLFERLEGVTVVVTEGKTDEGDVWFATDRHTLSFTNAGVYLFNGWELLAKAASVEELTIKQQTFVGVPMSTNLS
jgi:hypothetical protein